jgi:RNA polymerase sigma-70 factor (ECF subfamily)
MRPPVPTLDLPSEVLLADVARGEREAFAIIYDRHSAVVFGLGLRILRDRGMAEELVQDVFVSVWRRAAAFDPQRAGAAAWIASIARNAAIDRLRREQARPAFAAGDMQGESFAGVAAASSVGGTSVGVAVDPARAAEVTEERQRVRAALEQLVPAQRRMLELAYFGGLSQSQIAEQVDVPVGTVKTRMFHGLRRLRELLDEEGGRRESARSRA